jgi:hypothetical protein
MMQWDKLDLNNGTRNRTKELWLNYAYTVGLASYRLYRLKYRPRLNIPD